VPADHLASASNVHRTRQSIESEARPVPELEGEDIWRRTDLEHHAVGAGAMEGAGRNQEMIVLPRRKTPGKCRIVKRLSAALGFLEAGEKRVGVGSVPATQIHHGVRARIENVVA